jgi:serine/threonine protein kinase
MPTDDASTLGDDYRVLGELHHSNESSAYAARHVALDRDVTVTVVRLAADRDPRALEQFASDAQLLSRLQHPNVLPVIESRWLSDDTFAVVRPQVRGSTLAQLLSGHEDISVSRVASAVEQVHAALEWARANGIVHRHIAPESMVFQHDSDRVLVGLAPAPRGTGALPDACDDTRTIGRLAWDMLSRGRAVDPFSLDVDTPRPALPRRIVERTQSLRHYICHSRRNTASRDVAAFVALLSAAAPALREAS